MSRYLAIINSRIRESRRKMLREHLQATGIDIAETTGPGHAVELARDSQAYEGLLAVGGDGTLHEVINGMDRQHQSVGIVLSGTLNGIARYTGFRRLTDLKNDLATGIGKLVDIIDAEYIDTAGVSHPRFFAGFLGIGFIGSNLRISRAFRPLPFSMRVILATTLNTLIQRAMPCKIRINNTEISKKEITSLIINNCISNMFSTLKSWGMQDGLLEVQAAQRWIPGQVLNNLALAFKFLPDPAGWLAGVKTVDASFSRPVDMVGDGELFIGIIGLKASVVPGGIHMIIPQNARLSYGMS